MAATASDIRWWFKRGMNEGATHMIVVCDTYDHEDYPVYVTSDENARAKFDSINGKNMQRVMEVYDLSMDLELQMSEHRAFHF